MRQKSTVTAPSEEQAQEYMKQFTNSNSELKKLEGEIELKINAIREKNKSKVDQLVKQRKESYEKLQAFAVGNRDSLFIKRKSIEWVHGILGFRTGTPKVTKKSGITWDAMLELLKGQNKTEFIRSKEEIDKDKILSSRDDENVMEQLNKLGISVLQDESFFVESKEEAIA